MEKLFFYKENTGDRDEVKYIEADIFKFECGHYFSSLNLQGSCFSEGFKLEEISFDDITTILTKSDFEKLDRLQKEIDKLGYNIQVDSEKYRKGLEIQKEARKIIEKLKSEENQKLFEKVIEDEKEIVKEEYDLTEEEIEEIFDNYTLDYRDKSIIGRIFDSVEECGEEEAENYFRLDDDVKRFFDFEAFGEELADSENYLLLESGRVVYYMY